MFQPVMSSAFRPVGYQPPSIRPHAPILAYAPPSSLGAPADLNVGDWLLLVGSAIVTGVGVNGLITQASSGRPNAVGILLDLVFLGLGGTIFVQKFSKMTY